MKTLNENNGIYFIEENGKMCACPFRGPILVPNQLAQRMDLVPIECSNVCALFDVDEIDGQKYAVLRCTSPITTIKEAAKPTLIKT